MEVMGPELGMPTWMHIPRLLLILLLGSGSPDGAPPARDMDALLTPAPIVMTLDMNALRREVQENERMKQALYQGKDPKEVYESTAVQVAGMIGMPPEALTQATSGLRSATVILRAIKGRPRGNPFRMVILLDRGAEAKPVLEDVLARFIEMGAPVGRTTYAGKTIHAVGGRAGEQLWLAEHDGLTVLTTGAPLLQEMVMRLSSAKAPFPLRAAEGMPWLQARAEGPSILDLIFPTLGRHDDDDVAVLAAALGFGEIENVTLSLTGGSVTGRVQFYENAPLAKALTGPEKAPDLLSGLPNKAAIAAVASVRDPEQLWAYVRSVGIFAEAAGRPQKMMEKTEVDELEEDFARGCAISLPQDVVPNLAAMGVVVPALQRPRDIETGALLFASRDAAKAAPLVNTLTQHIGPKIGNPQEEAGPGGARLWRLGEGGGLAWTGGVLVAAHPRGTALEPVVNGLAAKDSALATELKERFPWATSFASIDAGLILPLGGESLPFHAGLHCEKNVLRIEMQAETGNLDQVIEQYLQEAVARAKRTQSMAQLRQLYMGLFAYLNDTGNVLPADLNAIAKYINKREDIFIDPVSEKPYVYFKEIAGKKRGDLARHARIPVAHVEIPENAPDDWRGAIVFLDGHARSLSAERLQRALDEGRTHLKEAGAEVGGDEPEEIF